MFWCLRQANQAVGFYIYKHHRLIIMIRKDLPVPDVLPLHVRLSAAANFLKLSLQELGGLLGLPASEVEKVIRGELACPDTASQEAEQVVALFKTLNRFVGKEEVAGRWLRNPSPAFNCKPIDMLAKPGGTKLVLDYLKITHRQL